MKALKKHCNAIIAVVFGGAYVVSKYAIDSWQLSKEFLLAPVISFLIPKVWQKIARVRETAPIDDCLAPETRKRVKDDAITSNAQLEKQADIQGRIERLLW